jgi:hypothetical protein
MDACVRGLLLLGVARREADENVLNFFDVDLVKGSDVPVVAGLRFWRTFHRMFVLGR